MVRLPEERLAAALLAALGTFDFALREDERANAISSQQAERLRNHERQETARVLAELRELARRYPNPPHRSLSRSPQRSSERAPTFRPPPPSPSVWSRRSTSPAQSPPVKRLRGRDPRACN
jgi:hypothetical protein